MVGHVPQGRTIGLYGYVSHTTIVKERSHGMPSFVNGNRFPRRHLLVDPLQASVELRAETRGLHA